jgi:hypothetical protein
MNVATRTARIVRCFAVTQIFTILLALAALLPVALMDSAQADIRDARFEQRLFCDEQEETLTMKLFFVWDDPRPSTTYNIFKDGELLTTTTNHELELCSTTQGIPAPPNTPNFNNASNFAAVAAANSLRAYAIYMQNCANFRVEMQCNSTDSGEAVFDANKDLNQRACEAYCEGLAGNPIAFQDGRKVQSQLLFGYPVMGGALQFSIHYDSGTVREGNHGMLGDGWTHSYNIWIDTLTENVDPAVRVLHIGDYELYFLQYESGLYDDDYDCSRTDVLFHPVVEAETLTALEIKIGLDAYVFEEIAGECKCTGIVRVMEESEGTYRWDGFRTTLTYNGSTGKLTSITDPSGEYVFTFNYYASTATGQVEGMLESIEHPASTPEHRIRSVFTYTNEHTENLVESDYNLETVAVDVSDGVSETTTYGYYTPQGEESDLF